MPCSNWLAPPGRDLVLRIISPQDYWCIQSFFYIGLEEHYNNWTLDSIHMKITFFLIKPVECKYNKNVWKCCLIIPNSKWHGHKIMLTNIEVQRQHGEVNAIKCKTTKKKKIKRILLAICPSSLTHCVQLFWFAQKQKHVKCFKTLCFISD